MPPSMLHRTVASRCGCHGRLHPLLGLGKGFTPLLHIMAGFCCLGQVCPAFLSRGLRAVSDDILARTWRDIHTKPLQVHKDGFQQACLHHVPNVPNDAVAVGSTPEWPVQPVAGGPAVMARVLHECGWC